MVSTTSFALVAVPLVAFGYAATSFSYCELERRQRDDQRLRNVPEATVVSLVALLTAALGYFVTEWVADPELGYVVAQVPSSLLPWQEVALWTGVAAVLGHVAPVWNGYRGGSGLAPAAFVAFAFVPLVLFAGLGGWFAAMVVSKHSQSPTRLALLVAVLASWIAWTFGVSDGWGVPLGAEATLAVTTTAGLVLARAHVEGRRKTA
jgi:glycerol-3-phosphate acyltransferase PlsY